MNSFFKGLAKIFKAYLDFLKHLPGLLTMLLVFLRGLWRALRRCFRRPESGGCCVDVPPSVHVRADPMIYDQYYLMSQGLSVTWDNPDIQLFDLSGNPAADILIPDTDYKVVVRVWNNSYDLPAPSLPVFLSFLSFGIGITSTPVGVTPTNLGAKGTAQCPAFADFIWHTPPISGHYCLQAFLLWTDDANPFNNLGQKNTQVGKLKSPATFTIPVHNQATVERRFEIEADMYQLPKLPSCGEQRQLPPRKKGRFAESQARWAEALRTQRYGMFPVTPDWKVMITPNRFDLGAGASTTITVSIEPASGPFKGHQAFNIHGFASPATGPRTMAGGVTLQVQGS